VLFFVPLIEVLLYMFAYGETCDIVEHLNRPRGFEKGPLVSYDFAT
jgi:hypothetical protein